MAMQDSFGYGTVQKTEEQLTNERIIQDAITVWNRLIDNKGPIGLQKDQMQWKQRASQLMDDEGFRNFLKAETIEDKIITLRDTGLGTNKQMSDQELGQFLMTHAPSGLTEDPKVSEEAIEKTEWEKKGWKEPFLSVGKLNKEGTELEGDPYLSIHRTGSGLIDKIKPDLEY